MVILTSKHKYYPEIEPPLHQINPRIFTLSAVTMSESGGEGGQAWWPGGEGGQAWWTGVFSFSANINVLITLVFNEFLEITE